MRLLTGLLLSMLLMTACEKEKNAATPPADDRVLLGRYVGTFSRSGMDTVTVSILFKDKGSFEGSGDREKYPASCNGSFTTDNSFISFSDSCTWIADFDWTLILNGTYDINYKDDRTVRISRTNGTITDEYIISKTE